MKSTVARAGIEIIAAMVIMLFLACFSNAQAVSSGLFAYIDNYNDDTVSVIDTSYKYGNDDYRRRTKSFCDGHLSMNRPLCPSFRFTRHHLAGAWTRGDPFQLALNFLTP
jgi:hypothetical protein